MKFLSAQIKLVNVLALSLVLLATSAAQTDTVSELREQIADLRAMMEAQQATIDNLSSEVASLRKQAGSPATSDATATVHIRPPQEGEPSIATNELIQTEVLPLEEEPLTPKQESWLSFKHKDWAFEVYGYVKLDLAYDTQHTFNGDFARYVLPETNGPDDQLSYTARQTRLGFNVQGPEWDGWKPGARVETDFYGDANSNTPTLRLRLAYAEMLNEDWRIVLGQDWDALVVALPKVVNFATYNNQGALWSRRPQAKAEWTNDVGHGKLKLRGAVAGMESGDLDGNGQPDGDDSGIPNLEGTVVYEMPLSQDWTLTSAIGGAWGREAYHTPSGTEADFTSGVVMFTGILDWKGKAKLLGSIWTGQSLGGFGGGIGQSVNLVKMESITSRGGWIQLQTFPTNKLNWNITFGLDDPIESDLSPGMRSFNMDASSSVFYQITPYLTLALEYSFLQTDYYQQAEVDSHRIQTSIVLEF